MNDQRVVVTDIDIPFGRFDGVHSEIHARQRAGSNRVLRDLFRTRTPCRWSLYTGLLVNPGSPASPVGWDSGSVSQHICSWVTACFARLTHLTALNAMKSRSALAPVPPACHSHIDRARDDRHHRTGDFESN